MIFQLDQTLGTPRGMQHGLHDDGVGRIHKMQSDSGQISTISARKR